MLCFSNSSRSCIKRATAGQLKSQAAVQLKQTQPAAARAIRKMMLQKGISTVVFAFALVTLLSCFSPVSSIIALPRVTRTSDAIIIDYDGVGYFPFSVGRVYGQFVDPGYVPLPAFDPYGMLYGGWAPFGRQTAPAPAPAPATCGRGPAPPARSAIIERVDGSGAAPVTSSKTWPFLVVLRKITDDPDVFFCSGTLISDTKVLMAAQCLEKLSLFEISTVTVLVGLIPGATSLTTTMTRRISRVVIHSGYNAANYASDIAIITLDMPVVISRTVSTACLAPASTDPDQYADKDAAVMGWGPSTKGDPSSAATFKQGKISIVPNDQDCRSQDGYGRFVTANNICISGTDTNVFTCPGDIGGPVVINTAAATAGTPPVWTVVGINSFTADDACSASANGLKTRVSAFADWIKTYSV